MHSIFSHRRQIRQQRPKTLKGKGSEVGFVAAFRFAGVSDLTGTTTEPDSPGI